MLIEILGSGCPNCKALESRAMQAIEEMGVSAEIKEVRDYAEIASYGVMHTPALAINGKVVSAGRVLKVDEIRSLIAQVTDRV